MIIGVDQFLEPANTIQPKWFQSPVMLHRGSLSDIRQYIPTFYRQPFGFNQPGIEPAHLHEQLDMIVRFPHGLDKRHIPVGVVSKQYSLVQHTAILDIAIKGLITAEINESDVYAEVSITGYGERMALSLYLPDNYMFNPIDRNPMALRLELTNSVDGSTRFHALLGWFRFVCSNGLIIGVTHSDLKRRHSGNVKIEDLGAVLISGIRDSEIDKKNFEKWHDTSISINQLVPWVEDELRKGWGFKAATRAFHIARCGRDVKITGRYKDNTPTSISILETYVVPGTPKECTNLFDLSQILAWLAKERTDMQEQLEWREKIPELMAPLLN